MTQKQQTELVKAFLDGQKTLASYGFSTAMTGLDVDICRSYAFDSVKHCASFKSEKVCKETHKSCCAERKICAKPALYWLSVYSAAGCLALLLLLVLLLVIRKKCLGKKSAVPRGSATTGTSATSGTSGTTGTETRDTKRARDYYFGQK
ncbi:unnamed protein product [Caenorhabditis sp. 36 PRJEB53466]|nr:unnamed protein product [Caenorhabditis sp. 36 PRJEB53466]